MTSSADDVLAKSDARKSPQQLQMIDQPVVFVTGNKGKLEDFRALLLNHPKLINCFDFQDVDLAELQGSHEKIAVEKCRGAVELLRRPVVIEDTSLELNALNGLPGPYIKWFWKALRNEGLPNLLAAFSDKSAVAVSIVAYCEAPDAEVRLFFGECRGRLLPAPKGPPVHGWLPLFVPDGQEKSLAEMQLSERYSFHHRAKALSKFFAYYIQLAEADQTGS